MHSLPRDAVHSMGCAVARCPITCRYCAETTKHIPRLFSSSGSYTILVFRTVHYGNILTGTPWWGRWMPRGMKKNAIIHKNISIYLRNDTRYSQLLWMGIGNCTQAFERYHFGDLEWSLTQIWRSHHYWMLNVTETVWDSYKWSTNEELQTPYWKLSFRMILSELAKYSMTRSIVQSLCDSWASFRWMFVLLWNYSRYEWYQTETHVVVSVLVKNVKKEDLNCDIQQSSVSF